IEICAPLNAQIHDKVKQLVPADVALRFHVLPIAMSREGTSQTLFVATADPLDMAALETIRTRVGPSLRVRWILAGETEIELALARHYSADPPGLKKAPAHFPPSSAASTAASSAAAAGDLQLTPASHRTNGQNAVSAVRIDDPIPLDDE